MRASVLGAPNLLERSAWLDPGNLLGRHKSGSWISDNYPQGAKIGGEPVGPLSSFNVLK
jgi:hypothetical protein